MKNKIQDIFEINPNVASSEELEIVVQKAEKLLEDAKTAKNKALRRESKAEIRRKQSEYKPVIPIYRMEYHWQAIVNDLEGVANQNRSISADVFYRAVKNHQIRQPQDKRRVWKCPKCGNNSLYIRVGSDHKHQVGCGQDDCEWTCPKRASTSYDAWEGFEDWLKKNGWYDFEEKSVLDEYFPNLASL